METDGDTRIGILCSEDQPVFTVVAKHLRKAGYTVRFFDPQTELSPNEVDTLSLIVNKQVFPINLPPLRYARRTGTPLWNNLPATVVFSSRLIGLKALDRVGFRTPEVTFEKPDEEYVAKGYFVWNGDPELNGDGDFYQKLIPTQPVDYKYYAVNSGSQVCTGGRLVTSKLYGSKRFLETIQASPRLTSCLRQLLVRTGLRGIGVDFVRDNENQFWAVDINLAAGYRNTGLESALRESICASLSEQ